MPPEAMQQVMGFGLFAGLAVGLEDKGMELLAFAHDIVINSGEDGNGFGVERLLFLPRRHGQPLGVEQHFGQGGWPFLSGQLLHIDQFAQQVGIAQRMHTIVEFPIRRPAIVHQHAKSFGQDAMRGHGVHAALFVQAIPGQRGGGGHMQPMQFWWHPAMMDYPPCVYNSFLVDSLRLNSYVRVSFSRALNRFL